MIAINVTRFRRQLPSYLRQVQQGEEVVVTSRGVPIARVIPALDARASASAALADLRGRCRLGDVVSPIQERWDALDDSH